MSASSKCLHLSFTASAKITRLTNVSGENATGFMCGMRVKCAACGMDFRFVGAPYGVSLSAPTLSPDGREMRAPIEPIETETILGRPVEDYKE